MRYFSHLNAVWQCNERWGFTFAWDSGIEQENNSGNNYNLWTGLLADARYSINEQWNSAFRYEYYRDPLEIIAETTPRIGYIASGISSNLDYLAYGKLLCRIEAKYFFSSLDIYPKNGD